MPSFADRLHAARHRHFVGRVGERALFESTLESEEPPFHLFYVYGPGGVGKTALLGEFRRLCREQEVPSYYLDARDVAPAAEDFTRAAKRVAGTRITEEAPHEGRFVLLIDTLETLAPLEHWLRTSFLPELPAQAIVVLSGRDALPAAWRADAGLQTLMHVAPLRNLPPQESRRYLTRRGVPEAQHEAVLRFAHGHPLALSLVADVFAQQPDMTFTPVEAPDLVASLLKRFVLKVPSSAHRTALQACALVHTLTEPLLAQLLDAGDVHELFDWLRTLSFIEAGATGLFPHDLAREALVADLRWRDPQKYEALHHRARRHYSAGLRRGEAPEAVLTDYVYLYRYNPVVQPYFRRLRAQWEDHAPLFRDHVREADWPLLRDMTERHEGEEAVLLLDYWKERQPGRVQVLREEGGTPAGFVFPLALHEMTEAERERDPCVQAACSYLEDEAPLRSGEEATLFRFWTDRDSFQALSPVQSLIAAYRVHYYLTEPALAFTFVPCAAPEQWALVFAYADLLRLPSADFSVDGRTYGLFGHDWRAVPPAAWLELLADREIASEDPEAVPRPAAAATLVLSRPDFDEAVKEALQHYARPEALRDHPLLRARLVIAAAGAEAEADARIRALRTHLREAAETLQASPREAKYYRALHATYLDPAPTQEKASEQLDVPFSTFRRHLRRGIEHVAETLWQRETGSAAVGA